MKRLTAVLLILAILMSCAACGGKGKKYKLVSVPEKLQLDTSLLSEDTDDLLSAGDRTPLIAAIPEEGLYVYCTDATIVAGVLVKYDGRIQYFPWRFAPRLAETEVCFGDYNADGARDIALTYCDTASELKRNENLHILLAEDGQFRDMAYRWESVAMDATIGLTVEETGTHQFRAALDGKELSFPLQNDGFGAYLGIRYNRYQDFTLGETITAHVMPGLVFENVGDAIYDVLMCSGTVAIREDGLHLSDLQVYEQ